MDQYDSFGVEELRDGFFDASFCRSSSTRPGGLDEAAEEGQEDRPDFTLTDLKEIVVKALRDQIEDSKFFFTSTIGTRDGVLLAKAFLGYFIAYILCLIPRTQEFLGKYSYWVTVATLFNHAGRSTGAQIDGTIGCIFGGALGLGIGCLALEVASAATPAREGYGGILAGFLIPPIAVFSWIRCSLLRFYQAMITAGLALIFLCLVETDVIARTGVWERSIIREFAVPWLVGLGICLVVNVCLYPETGGGAVAYANTYNPSMSSAFLGPRKTQCSFSCKKITTKPNLFAD